ncbi:growth/differentiation factor 8-like isoform X4 [Palaemon carinicauda]|uniref:growth/differentiation factor 8-like isoform X1 n=1 Tax=Palaemon carinicauda TaxID=392227 RepID=UPI0035B6161E
MERLLHLTAGLLSCLLVSTAPSTALTIPSQMANQVDVNFYHRTEMGNGSEDSSGGRAPHPSMTRDFHPDASKDKVLIPEGTVLPSLTEMRCPRCAVDQTMTYGSLSPSSDGESSSQDPSSRLSPSSLPIKHQILTEEDMQNLRLERFKAQILSKMYLKERPHVTLRREDLPSIISNGVVSEMIAGSSGPTEPPSQTPNTVILSTKNTHCRGHRTARSSCFIVTLEGSTSGGISKAVLWFWKVEEVHRDFPHTIIVRQIPHHPRHSHGRGQGTAVSYNMTTSRSGWTEIDVTQIVTAWMSSSRREFKLEIFCASCREREDGPASSVREQWPFIIVTQEEPKVRQRRSSTECSTGSEGGCCRASMNVTAAQMGWEDWIIHPPWFQFYYCRGHCRPTMQSVSSSNMSNYNMVLQRLSTQPDGSPQQAALMPCCSPTTYSPIDILYIINSTVQYRRFTDLIVASCGCNG